MTADGRKLAERAAVRDGEPMTSDREHLNAALAHVRAAIEDAREVKLAAGDAARRNNCGEMLRRLVDAAEAVEAVRDGGTPAARGGVPMMTRWDVAVGAMIGNVMGSGLLMGLYVVFIGIIFLMFLFLVGG